MNDLSNDIVVEQTETTYDRGGNVVLTTRFERLHDATGTGALHGPNGTQPRARRSYLGLYQDAIGRHRFSADFGTNGGAELERPETPPTPSETVLVFETRYAADGQAGCETGPDGAVGQTTRNCLGEPIRTVEVLGTAAERTQRFRYHSSGQLSHLILDNPDTGEQVTEWIFGTNLGTSDIARNDLISGKIYPTGESESSTFNRQSGIASRTDPNGSVREFRYDQLGQLTS
jgi:hypothetical protein